MLHLDDSSRTLLTLLIGLAALIVIPGSVYLSQRHINLRLNFARIKQPLLELGLVTLIASLYIGRFMTLKPAMTFGALEHERLSGVLLPIKLGIEQYGHIPQWNPYMAFGGEPTIGNPFNYLFNPFMSVPVLSLGAVQGTKVAFIISLLIAGYGMWFLMRLIGVGGVARVTSAGLYLMSGAIAAKFASQFGHFQLALSMAWIPVVLAGLWWTLHSRNRFAPVFMAVSFAMLFFAGNIYFTLHTLVAAVVITLFHVIDRDDVTGLWTLCFDRVGRVLLGAVFAFGLSMLQFWPVWAVRDSIAHQGDAALSTRYGFGQAFLNFIAAPDQWSARVNDSGSMLQLAVDYAYIGLPVFALILTGVLLLMFTRFLRLGVEKRPFIIAALLALIMMVWGMGQTSLLEWLYTHSELLSEFRFVGRAMGIAALWWIVLAGLAIDLLWRGIGQFFQLTPTFNRQDATRLLRVLLPGIAVWGWLGIYSIQNNSTRLAMVLDKFDLFNRLNAYTFDDFAGATTRLWQILLIAAVMDSVLWIVSVLLLRFLQPRNHTINQTRERAQYARILRIGVMAAAVFSMMDMAAANQSLIQFVPDTNPFMGAYGAIRRLDGDTPFPAIAQPFSRFTIGAYDQQMRSWSLTEGWTPLPKPFPIMAGRTQLFDLPRWALVWSESPGGYQQALDFVDQNPYQLRFCLTLVPRERTIDACDPAAQPTVMLFESPDALPYAYVIDIDTLSNVLPTTRAAVTPAQLVEHIQDRIVVRIDALPAGLPAHLVIQEANFPGWRAFIDGERVPVLSAGNSLAVELQPGGRIYTFEYRTPGLALGVVSFVFSTIVMALWLLIFSKRVNWRQLLKQVFLTMLP